MTDEELQNYIDTCHTELFANMDEDNALCQTFTKSILLIEMRKRGNDNCGFEGIRPMRINETSCVFALSTITNGEANLGTEEMPMVHTGRDERVTKQRLAELLIQVIRRHVASLEELAHVTPNGSAKSIVEWAKTIATDPYTRKVDRWQQRAFEVIVSMFILTFHREANLNEGLHATGTQYPGNRACYVKLKRQLKAISGMGSSTQLIMFLTGPGGSGKTRIINAVLAYAKGFCKELNYLFDKRMIVVTALTGVATTLINRETIHSAAKLYNKKISAEHIDEWKNT